MRQFAIVALLPLAACSMNIGDDNDAKGVPGSGSGNARSYAVSGFTGVSLRGSDDVDVRVGSAFSVRAEGPSKDLDKLVIDVRGDTLRIGRKGSSFHWGGGDRDRVRIFVTMPKIATANVAGSGDMKIDRVDGGNFEANAAGSGDMTIGSVTADNLDISVAGSGGVAISSGTARQLKLAIAGSGDVDAARLKASGADVSIAGSGNASADVAGDAKVSIVGSGDADLGKDAKCSVSKLGSGSVTCGTGGSKDD